MKYKAVISFEIEIEATDISTVDYICKQAQPTHFEFTTSGTNTSGHGRYVRGLNPITAEIKE